MIEIEIEMPMMEEKQNNTTISLSNERMVELLSKLPEDEYIDILERIFVNRKISVKKLSVNNIMRIFAMCGNHLKKTELNPAQLNALKVFIKNFEI